MRVIRVVPFTTLVLGAMLLGCAGGPRASRPSADRNVLVRSQFADRGYKSAYEVVQTLRSTWLSARGTDSFTTPTEVQVYLDDLRLGGVETLKTIDVQSLASMRFLDGNAATARWGLGHGAGVIYLSTRIDDRDAKPPE